MTSFKKINGRDILLMILSPLLLLLSCSEVRFIGNSRSGYIKDLSFKISPEKAVELAEPYLDLSYGLRVKNRNKHMQFTLHRGSLVPAFSC